MVRSSPVEAFGQEVTGLRRELTSAFTDLNDRALVEIRGMGELVAAQMPLVALPFDSTGDAMDSPTEWPELGEESGDESSESGAVPLAGSRPLRDMASIICSPVRVKRSCVRISSK